MRRAPASGSPSSRLSSSSIERFSVVADHRQHRDKARHGLARWEPLTDLEADRWHETSLRHGLTDCYDCRSSPPTSHGERSQAAPRALSVQKSFQASLAVRSARSEASSSMVREHTEDQRSQGNVWIASVTAV